jgi:PTH1 family peptidyl-tRNA hydrolase
MKYLIVGLGNIGDEYDGTRHNIGFHILDAFAKASNCVFEDRRYGFVGNTSFRGRQLVLLKPSTYMNLSGLAVRYWMQKEKIPIENLLVLVDDVALPLGTLRLKPKGSCGGHNGLRNIEDNLGTQNYARLRFGIGNDFPRGCEADYVLSKFPKEEWTKIDERVENACNIIKSFIFVGIQTTMNQFNNQ